MGALLDLALEADCPPQTASLAGQPPGLAWDHAQKPTIMRELGAERLEARRAKVENRLGAHPELKRAIDVTDAPLEAGPGEPVSVVLAVRHGEHILSGELHIPRDRWDTALFLHTVDNPSEQPS